MRTKPGFQSYFRVFSESFACLTLFLFLNSVLLGQPEAYRGIVKVKTFKVDNHISKSSIAKMISKNHGIPIAELDTLYRTHYICGDSMAIYFSGVEGIYQSSELQTDSLTYLYDQKNLKYLKMRLLPRSLSSIKAKDWKRYRRKAAANPFALNYKMIHPRFKTSTYWAKVDQSVIYPDEQRTQGQFCYIFHPFGRIETLVQQVDTMKYITHYTYKADPSLRCATYFKDLDFDEIGEDSTPSLGPNTSKELIPEEERLPLITTELRDTNGRQVSLEGFAGKFVYIDMWASWCAPCRREMPFTQKIREHYSAEKLEIVSISIDQENDLDNWRKSIDQLQMQWHNWIVYKGFESDFADKYGIKAIPRYLLLDPKGRIMNDNAPRPSDEELIQLLDQLIR